MELYRGLPLRTIEAENLEGTICIFGVTTDQVNDLVGIYFASLATDWGLDEDWIEEFDNSYQYAVPQEIFEEADDEELIEWINQNIEHNFKTQLK